MNYLKITLSLGLLFCISFSTLAQRGSGAIRKADDMFEKGYYYDAIDQYKKAYTLTDNPQEKLRMTHQIARCYQMSNSFAQAQLYFEKVIEAGYFNQDPACYYLLGDVHSAQGNYDEAIESYESYLELQEDDQVSRVLKQTRKALEWMKKPTGHIVKPVLIINSPAYDFGPSYADEEHHQLIFSSSREGSTGGGISSISGENFQDLFFTELDKKGKWSEPVPLDSSVNTPENEGAGSLTGDYQTLYFTRCASDDKADLGCDIFMSQRNGQGWGTAVRVPCKPEDSTHVSVGHPAVSADGKLLVFVSDMLQPGQAESERNKNLWAMRKDPTTGEWGAPETIDGPINTKKREMFPYLAPDGTLYLASDGHPGMGGLDIFKAKPSGDGPISEDPAWEKPENMKYPINSPSQDYGIIFDQHGESPERGYFVSHREGSKGKADIFSFRLPPPIYALTVHVTDAKTEEPLANTTISLLGSDNSSYEVQTDENGTFEFTETAQKERYIKPATTYNMVVSKSQYFKAEDKITTAGVVAGRTFVKEVVLEKIEIGKAIEFPEVRYAFGKAELLVDPNGANGDPINSTDSLDFLLRILEDNPRLIVQLEAHTDNRGTAEDNLTLSQARAQSCVDYLISKGVHQGRLNAKGFGEDKPKRGLSKEEIDQMMTREEQEAAHAKNRRTEFSVLSFDWNPAVEQ